MTKDVIRLTAAQSDRAIGVLLGSAVGDALGAGYEFGAAPYDGAPRMIGGGLGDFAPGEWTDDTAQAVAIARVAASGADLTSEAAHDLIAAGFLEWFRGGPPDVGNQTRQVLGAVGSDSSARRMRTQAQRVHEISGRSAGNGSLMRTAPVALAFLRRPESELVEAAMAISALTHHDPLAREGAALWCLMIRHAVLHGEFPDAGSVLAQLPHADYWAGVLAEAEAQQPDEFSQNGWVVGALRAAWSAIRHTPTPEVQPCRHLQDSLATAIGIGHDTDTVAAIAGGLLGARWGQSAIPQEWLGQLHGWGAQTQGAAHLVRWAIETVQGGPQATWPSVARVDYPSAPGVEAYAPHPLVDGVWIGGVRPLDRLPDHIDAVVSLCRVGAQQVPVESYVVRLLDTDCADNPNLDFAVDDAARTVLRLLKQGKRVFLHCVAAHSRTPTVAARVAMLSGHEFRESLDSVCAALPAANPQGFLIEVLGRLRRSDARAT
ncbi:MAG: ADP-ribosylglycohydrolase family protein [Nocardioides sp.]|jgi:ADP-ribosyl-[dinitrogen reductase] hydrolase